MEQKNIIRNGLAVALLAFSGMAQAKLGGDQSATGVANWMSGSLPPAGDYLVVNSGHYGGKLRDGNGDKIDGASVDVWFSAFRHVHMTRHKLWGGDYGWQVVVPVIHQQLKMQDVSKRRTSIADITLNPFILAWHRDNLHWVLGLDVNLPTGAYDAKEPRRSVGVNYWSLEPLLAVTWLSDDGWEISNKMMYNIKTRNKNYRAPGQDTKQKYHSGQEFHMDYLLGKRFERWGVGVAGYYLKQLTNDRIDGQTVTATPQWGHGRKGQVFSYGPSVSYNIKKGMSVSAQWNHEIKVKNRFSGDKVSVKLVTSF